MNRKHAHRLAATIAVLGATAVPIASASAAGAPAKVSLRKTPLGMILVNGRGRTLYAFTRDGKNKDRCITTSGCTSTWLVLTSTGKPKARPGVKSSKLSTIKLSNGSRQVTYAGHPLYYFIQDKKPGDTTGQGVNGFGALWWVLAPSGAAMH